MKTYKQFTEAAALAIPAAMKMAPYVIPAAGAAANIFKGMMQSDASDKFKARQRGGRISPGEAQRRQAREDRKAEARRRARENASKDKPTVENVPTAKKEKKEKVDPALERAAGQILDRLRNEEVQSEGAALAIKAGSSLIPKIMTGIGAVGTMLQASKADKERRRQLAKDNNLDITNPRDRATLGRLLKKNTEEKKRAEKGDTRSQEQYRQEKAENRKTIDATRQQMGQSKAEPGTKKRAEIDKKLKDFRDELRDVTSDPIVPSRARVRVKVGQEVPKPNTTQPPRTGASPQRVRDRRSYEAQQRRNRKMNEGMLPVPNPERRKFLKLQSILNSRNQELYDKATTPQKPKKGEV